MDNFVVGQYYQVKKTNQVGAPTVKLGKYLGKANGVLQFEKDKQHVKNARWTYTKCASGGRRTKKSKSKKRQTRRR